MSRKPGFGIPALAIGALMVVLALLGFQSAREAGVDVDSSARLSQEAQDARPAHWPERFGFGSPASEARIAEWDIDVKPDGEGLPPGSGTVAEGQRVYSRTCRSCHGATGVEGPEGALVGEGEWETWPPGRTVGVFWPYATTLFDYIVKAMPQKRPGTLTADETYAVMDARTLPAVEMPARDRFVPDNRTGGPVIR
jgi:cytochrome c